MNRTRHLAVAIFFLTTLSVFAQPAPPDLGADRVLFGKYTGAHANDPSFQKTRDSLESQKRDMLEEIYKLTGLSLPKGKKIHVTFNDNPANSPDPRAVTFATTQPHHDGALVTYSIANAHKVPVSPRPFLQHELFHAIQLCSMAQSYYNRIHAWVKEGIAIYVSGEGSIRVRNYYFSSRNKGVAPDKIGEQLCDGLLVRGKSTDYTEEYLAILYLTKMFGDDALKKLVHALTFERQPWQRALQNVTGLDANTFAANAKKFSVVLFANYGKHIPSNPPQAVAPPPETPPQQPPPPQPPPPRQKPSVGVGAQDPDPETARQLPDGKGVVLNNVIKGGLGESIGLRVGDAITQFNGKPVENVVHLRALLETVKYGDAVSIVVVRNGQSFRATLQFGK